MVSKAKNGSTPGMDLAKHEARMDPVTKKFMKRTFYDYHQVRRALLWNEGMVYKTAQYLNISPSTMYAYFKKWPTLRKFVKLGLIVRLDYAEMKLDEAIAAGDLQAIKYFLTRKGKGRGYGVTKVIEDKRVKDDLPKLDKKWTEEDKNKLLEEVKKQGQININLNITGGVQGAIDYKPEEAEVPKLPPIIVEGEAKTIEDQKEESPPSSQSREEPPSDFAI